MDIIQKKANFLAFYGVYSEKIALAIRQHHDVYYPYYMAANFYLASGQIEKYKEALGLAEIELKAMNKLIDELAQDNPQDNIPIF